MDTRVDLALHELVALATVRIQPTAKSGLATEVALDCRSTGVDERVVLASLDRLLALGFLFRSGVRLNLTAQGEEALLRGTEHLTRLLRAIHATDPLYRQGTL